MDNALKIIDVYDLDDKDGQFKRLITARNKCKKSFVASFPIGFFDPGYVQSMRVPLAAAHRLWVAELNKQKFGELLFQGKHAEAAQKALAIEAGTDLLNATEKAKLASALGTANGAQLFASGLYELLYSNGSEQERFENFSQVCARLAPADGKAGDLFTWQVVTVFAAIAQPRRHVFIKPIITRQAAIKYGFPFDYQPAPTWSTYSSMLEFAACLRADLSDLRPRDLLDIHAFISTLSADNLLV
jgi:hypothetical protein